MIKPRAALPARSKKRARQERQYSKVRKVFLDEHPYCGIQLEEHGCSGRATQVHHMKGRIGDLLLDQEFWRATCATCHQYVTEHPAFAYEEGHSLRRNATT